MTKIETDGFLSKETVVGKSLISKKYGDFFDYAKELNRYNMRLMKGHKIDWENKHALTVNILYIRIIETFQGMFLLLERGMMPQSKMLTRAMLEFVFILVALQKKPELLEFYQNQHEESNFRALKLAQGFKCQPLKEAAKEHELEKRYIDKKKERVGNAFPTLQPKGWAIEADLTDLYSIYYTTYSDAIHANPSALDDHVDDNPDRIDLSFGPSDNDLYDILKCGCYVLINAANSTALVHGQDISKKLDKFVNAFKSFDSKYIQE